MSTESIVETVKAEMKAAMKARDKERLATIRLIQSEFKRIEVDERVAIDDNRAIAILDKMVKQRRDSIRQYEDAGRQELADQEAAEVAVIQGFLPEPLSEEAIHQLIEGALQKVDAEGMAAMALIMAELKPQLQGRADMGAVSKLVKARLSGG
jgi:uncharacterized protein YqeY